MNASNFNGKENEFDMSKDLNSDFKKFVKDMTGINSDNELDVYLDNIISNGNFSPFLISLRENLIDIQTAKLNLNFTHGAILTGWNSSK